MNIGQNIKDIREKQNLTQSDLAELLGVSDKTVSSWEINRTEPKMGMVERICIALKCKKTDIIGSDDPTETVNFFSQDPDIRRIERARQNMPQKDRDKMMTLLKAAFEDYFGDDYIDEDND